MFEDERRNLILYVNDFACPFAHMLPSIKDPNFWYLNRIDPYGHTVFNQLQGPRLLEEWDEFAKRATTAQMTLTFARIRSSIEMLIDGVHRYLRFRGE